MSPGTDGHSPPVETDLHERPVELLQELIRFNTTNPPGDERACVEWIGDILTAYDLEYDTYANDPDRLNLVSRQSGGDAPALLLYGHVDVVPTEGQDWTHPPFEGVIEDDLVWGRGALDMKGGVAMMIAAYLRAAVEDIDLGGDLLLCILSDEEAGGGDGAAFMVEDHPEAFDGVEYAIGEFGGFSTEIAGERFYPIQMNEKVSCPMKATFTGPAGHGSSAHSGGAMAKMAKAITAVDESRLPVHIVPTVESMIEGMAEELAAPTDERLRALLDPDRTDDALDELAASGESAVADMLDPLLHNIANPTMINTGGKVNVIPASVELTMDCRLIPGQTDEDIERELRAIIPEEIDVDLEPLYYNEFPAETDADLFDLLGGVLEDADPDGTAIPYMLSGATDGRHLARIGIQSYGYTPMKLPEAFDLLDLAHAADERIPTKAVEFGADAIEEVVTRYDGT